MRKEESAIESKWKRMYKRRVLGRKGVKRTGEEGRVLERKSEEGKRKERSEELGLKKS